MERCDQCGNIASHTCGVCKEGYFCSKTCYTHLTCLIGNNSNFENLPLEIQVNILKMLPLTELLRTVGNC